MEILLLGTGSADGWPNPFCRCASCTALRTAGLTRGQSAALLDDTVLLDCGPQTPGAATRAGRALDGVRHVLLTHGHPDHTAPAFLLWRAWAQPRERLTVWGPAAAVEPCRDWVGPDDAVTFETLTAGERRVLPTPRGEYAVQALAAAHSSRSGAIDDGTALLYDITGPDRGRLLYATDTGPLPADTWAALAGVARYDVVLLEETFGDTTGHGTGHLDLPGFAAVLARLRETRAVTATTQIAPIHLSHHNPPDLHRRLAGWGVRLVDDLDILDTRGGRRASSRPAAVPHRALILGGARSGKSSEAERRLAAASDVLYVATAAPRNDDPEWQARVQAHVARRPTGWTTTQTLDVAGVLRRATGKRAVLVDCLTLWLTAHLDARGTWWDDPTLVTAVLADDVPELVEAVRDTRAQVVLVSNEVGWGLVPERPAGRVFRDALGRLNAAVAAVCDSVDLVVAGRVLPLTAAAAGPDLPHAGP